MCRLCSAGHWQTNMPRGCWRRPAIDPELRAMGLYGLSRCIEKGKGVRLIQLADGRCLARRQLLQEALQCNPNCSRAYFNFGFLLSKDETVMPSDGRVMGKRQLFIEALRCNSNYAHAYNNPAIDLGKDETVILSDRRVMDKRQLIIEALRCQSDYSIAYCYLGAIYSRQG